MEPVSATEVWDLLLGPLGLTAGVVVLTWLFISERVVPKGRLEDQKDLTKQALDIARDANRALEKLADAVETRNRIDEERSRSGDGP